MESVERDQAVEWAFARVGMSMRDRMSERWLGKGRMIAKLDLLILTVH